VSPPYFYSPFVGWNRAYKNLVPLLRDNLTLYGVHAYAPQLERATTIEEIASIYIAHIIKTQPAGPYRLAGYSLGATIASVVARALTARWKNRELFSLSDLPMIEPLKNSLTKPAEKWDAFVSMHLGEEDEKPGNTVAYSPDETKYSRY